MLRAFGMPSGSICSGLPRVNASAFCKSAIASSNCRIVM